MSKKQSKTVMDRETEIQGAKIFGKHVSEEKGRILLIMTLLACATPILGGLRLWDQIPEIYETGLIGANGEDDSLPRWAIVYAIPALMCLLNFLCHNQLRMSQKKMVLPKAHFRLVGRWGFPIISVLFAGGLVREAAGLAVMELTFLTPCVLGLAFMMLGGHMYDCREGSVMSLSFSFLRGNSALHKELHRFTGLLWMIVGLAAIALAMATGTSSLITAVLFLAALAAPWLYGRSRAGAL